MKRFWKFVNKLGPYPNTKKYPKLKTRCWLWTSSLNNKGYGRFSFEGRNLLAHRVAWYIQFGVFPKDCLLHKCDTENCIRWSHCFEGSKGDNNKDKVLKGRSCKGERHFRAKLSNADVRQIRRLAASGVSGIALQNKFGVTSGVVSQVINKKAWSHV